MNESEQVEKDLEKINKYLDDFTLKCGLPNTINDNTVNLATALMNIDFSSYRPTPEECQENAVILSQYLLNLGRVISREKCIVHWAKEKIKKMVVPNMKNQKAYNYEERLAGAIAENTEAQQLNYIKLQSELKLMKLENDYFNVKEICHRMSEWSRYVKRYETKD